MTGRLIIVGVCTFKRPSLRRTLLSLVNQELPAGTSMRIVVADNDDTPSAKPLVSAVSLETGQEIVYLHCPARNISVARNGVLNAARDRDADFVAFIDDDEWVGPDWLSKLLAALDEAGAAGVFGPVQGVYGELAPSWMKTGGFHDMTPEVDAAGHVRTGHTCNVLLALGHPAFAGRQFDLDFGRSGGEDTEFFATAKAAGAYLAPAHFAVAFEDVPSDRAQLRWLVQRRFRMGQTHGELLRRGARPARRAALALIAVGKVAACVALMLPALPRAERRNRVILRLSLHAGAVSTLLGMRGISLYGVENVSSRAKLLTRPKDRSAS